MDFAEALLHEQGSAPGSRVLHQGAGFSTDTKECAPSDECIEPSSISREQGSSILFHSHSKKKM